MFKAWTVDTGLETATIMKIIILVRSRNFAKRWRPIAYKCCAIMGGVQSGSQCVHVQASWKETTWAFTS